jgi:hypothetical protein
MSRRRADSAGKVDLDVSEAERQVIGILQAKGGLISIANVIRSALWSMADEMGVEMEPGVFDQRFHQIILPPGPRHSTKPKVASNGGKKKPARNHPWREYTTPPQAPMPLKED